MKNYKSILEFIKPKVRMPKTVWDYSVISPLSLDDSPHITIYLQTRKQGKRRRIEWNLITNEVWEDARK